MKKVFVIGDSGATGVELINLLNESDFKNNLIIEHNDSYKDVDSFVSKVNEYDFLILCTPPDFSKEIVAKLSNYKGVIIDTSDAYRNNPDWLYAYNVNKILLKNVKRIANPGCFAQGMISLLEPISIVLRRNNTIQINGTTGFSAGGKSVINKLLDSDFTTKFTNLNRVHTHELEVNEYFGNKFKVMFIPQVSNFVRGQSVGVVLKTTDVVYNTSDSFNLIKELYKQSDRVNLLEESSSFDLNNVNNGFINVSVTMPSNDRIIVNAYYDNLNIGASGNVVKILEAIG